MISAVPDLATSYRDAMRRVASTVTIITATDLERHHGMTATAVTSVSMDPPSLLICVNTSTRLHDILVQGQRFCVNILNADQADLSRAFSGALTSDERFAKGLWRKTQDGLGYLADAQANIFCEKAAAISHGTHTIFIGNVAEVRLAEAIDPLIYLNAGYMPATVNS